MSEQVATTSYSTANTANWRLTGWLIWSIAALFYAYELLHRVAPSILTSELREAFSVNDHQLGTLGAMYFYAYAAFQLPAGFLVDKYGAKKLLLMASAILTLGSFLFTTTSSSSVAYISRFMIGTGSAFAFVGCLKLGAEWLEMSSFPLIVGLTNLCGTLGALAGGAPLSYFVNAVGWREALMQISFAGLFLTFLLWIILRDKSSLTSMPAKNPYSMLAGLKLVIKNPQSWLIAFYGALLVVPIVALPEMWGVEFLKIAYEIPATQASGLTHTIFIGTAIGGPLIGWMMGSTENKIPYMMFSSLGALVLLSFFLYWTNLSFANLYILLFAYGVLTANMLIAFTLITKIHPLWAQGVAIGFTNTIIMASGGLAQHSIGWVLSHVRSLNQGIALIQDYQFALSLLPLSLLIAISLTLWIKPQP